VIPEVPEEEPEVEMIEEPPRPKNTEGLEIQVVLEHQT
jgi:hypothetical protein